MKFNRLGPSLIGLFLPFLIECAWSQVPVSLVDTGENRAAQSINDNFGELDHKKLDKTGGTLTGTLSGTTFSGDVFTGGTFSGTLITGTTVFADSILIDSATINGAVLVSGIMKRVCPSGFISLENANGQLGCLQSVHEGTDTWSAATNDCFTTYAGRLPSAAELDIGSINFSTILGEGFVYEWLENADYAGSAGYASYKTNQDTGYDAWNTSRAYRCFVPR